jgi:hypothetical protein
VEPLARLAISDTVVIVLIVVAALVVNSGTDLGEQIARQVCRCAPQLQWTVGKRHCWCNLRASACPFVVAASPVGAQAPSQRSLTWLGARSDGVRERVMSHASADVTANVAPFSSACRWTTSTLGARRTYDIWALSTRDRPILRQSCAA